MGKGKCYWADLELNKKTEHFNTDQSMYTEKALFENLSQEFTDFLDDRCTTVAKNIAETVCEPKCNELIKTATAPLFKSHMMKASFNKIKTDNIKENSSKGIAVE